LRIAVSKADNNAVSGKNPEISSGEGTLIQREGQVKDVIIVLPAFEVFVGR
jgi:hypothetical protein